MYAITVEKGPGNFPNRVILWQGLVQDNDKFQGHVIDVAEAINVRTALEYIVKSREARVIAILTDENTLDYPDEISLLEACEAYFGSRIPGLTF